MSPRKGSIVNKGDKVRTTVLVEVEVDGEIIAESANGIVIRPDVNTAIVQWNDNLNRYGIHVLNAQGIKTEPGDFWIGRGHEPKVVKL